MADFSLPTKGSILYTTNLGYKVYFEGQNATGKISLRVAAPSHLPYIGTLFVHIDGWITKVTPFDPANMPLDPQDDAAEYGAVMAQFPTIGAPQHGDDFFHDAVTSGLAAVHHNIQQPPVPPPAPNAPPNQQFDPVGNIIGAEQETTGVGPTGM